MRQVTRLHRAVASKLDKSGHELDLIVLAHILEAISVLQVMVVQLLLLRIREDLVCVSNLGENSSSI
eukprot:SAG31_NODE_3628_length_4050_cov_2.582890_3_plen_67_part_00